MPETLTARRFERFLKGREFMHEIVLPAIEKCTPDDAFSSIRRCGNTVNVLQCDRCATKHWKGFVRCKSKFCIPCSSVKTKIWLSKLVPILTEQIEKGNHVSLLSLTLVNHEIGELGIMIDRLNDAWRIMINGRGNRDKWSQNILGGVRSLEVKIGKDGKWHAHLHALLIHPKARFYEWIKAEWEKASACAMDLPKGSKVGSIDIRTIKTAQGSMRGVIEAVKYPMKPENGFWDNLDAVQEVIQTLPRRKQTQSFGIVRHMVSLVDQADEVDEKRLDNFICQACGCDSATLHSELLRDVVRSGKLYDIPKPKFESAHLNSKIV